MQSQLEKTKADYDKRLQDIKEEAEGLRTVIAELQAAKAELENKQRNAEGSLQAARDEAAQKIRQAQVGCTLQSCVHTYPFPAGIRISVDSLGSATHHRCIEISFITG